MGLFRKDKRTEAMLEGIQRDTQLGQQYAQQAIAGTGLDMASLMQAANAAMRPGVMQQMMAYRDRVTRLSRHGVEQPATVRAIQVGEHSPMLGGRSAQLQLSVQPPGAAPYEVATDQVLQDAVAAGLAPGAAVTVRVDPQDPHNVMIWGVAEPAAAPAPPVDRAARLAKLQQLHTMGALTDAEFAEQQAKLAAE